MYETLRIIDKLKPKYVIWENVANLLSEKHRHNYYNYLYKLEDLGYQNFYKVLNAKDYGIPQSRNRIFTVSFLNSSKFVYSFPNKQLLSKSYKDLLEETYDINQVVLSDSELTMIKNFGASYSFGGFVVRDKKIYPTITASYGKVSGNSGKIACKEGYRILTPKECWRLMGFDDEDYEKASQVNSSKSLYKQAGNSIVVDVLETLIANIFNITLDKNYAPKQKKLF